MTSQVSNLSRVGFSNLEASEFDCKFNTEKVGIFSLLDSAVMKVIGLEEAPADIPNSITGISPPMKIVGAIALAEDGEVLKSGEYVLALEVPEEGTAADGLLIRCDDTSERIELKFKRTEFPSNDQYYVGTYLTVGANSIGVRLPGVQFQAVANSHNKAISISKNFPSEHSAMTAKIEDTADFLEKANLLENPEYVVQSQTIGELKEVEYLKALYENRNGEQGASELIGAPLHPSVIYQSDLGEKVRQESIGVARVMRSFRTGVLSGRTVSPGNYLANAWYVDDKLVGVTFLGYAEGNPELLSIPLEAEELPIADEEVFSEVDGWGVKKTSVRRKSSSSSN